MATLPMRPEGSGPDAPRRNLLLWIIAGVLGLMGLALCLGGIWLTALGGSWYYLLAGALLIGTAFLLIAGRPAALWLFAALIVGTLVWSLWEVGFDWWPLAARGGVLVVVGALLLTPWVTRTLDRAISPVRGAGLPLTLSLAAALAVAVASWFVDPHRIAGAVAEASVDTVPVAADVAVPGEWPAYGRTGLGQRYSPLDQITPANVALLTEAWIYHTGDLRGQPGDPVETTFEVTPLKIDNNLFLCTPHQNVIALNATTGEEIWRYDPQIEGELALQHLTCRGLSYDPGFPATAATTEPAPIAGPAATPGQEPGLPVADADTENTASCTTKLLMPTSDGRLIALNPSDGAVCSNFGDGSGQINLWVNMPNVNPGAFYSTSPVVGANDRIVVGGYVLDNVSTSEASGVIRGYDATTGQLVWNWDAGNPTETAPIAPGETYTPNSPNSWSISSVDAELGLVYVPMGNQPPDQWGGNRGEGSERYASAVVALDLETGALRWSFQTIHHDLWDYDVPAQPSLVDLTIGGETVPALVQATKQGEIFVLDRRTGEPILPVTEIAAPQGAADGDFTAPTQPVSALSFNPPPLTGSDMWGVTLFDQLACRIAFAQLRYEGRYTPPSTQGTLVYPGNLGVFNWGGVAVDPVRQIVFATPTYLAFTVKLVPRADDTTLYVQGGTPPEGALPALNENFGAPFAVDIAPFVSALGVACQAPPWGYVAAADLTSGRVIWQHRNGTVRDSAPLPLPFRLGVPNLGGPILTGGGVAFLSGTLDYYVRAYDVTTGDELWRSRLPAGGQATPMTYTGDDGRQYLLVVAGGHGSFGTAAGDAVIAYALPR